MKLRSAEDRPAPVPHETLDRELLAVVRQGHAIDPDDRDVQQPLIGPERTQELPRRHHVAPPVRRRVNDEPHPTERGREPFPADEIGPHHPGRRAAHPPGGQSPLPELLHQYAPEFPGRPGHENARRRHTPGRLLRAVYIAQGSEIPVGVGPAVVLAPDVAVRSPHAQLY
ncbi:hypothetical protein [Dactylosporangium sp. NPDC049140]|uniref:hypothetical protein n=1 Tax=Dactylosporangium sp. NPDC049140 TaxID=3155647 RepID=UPI0033D15FD5